MIKESISPSSPVRLLLFYLVILVCLVGAGFACSIFLRNTSTNRVPSSSSTASAGNPLFSLTGCTIFVHEGEKQQISIKADKITLQRKKIGFLRIGLLRELILVNGQIIINYTSSGTGQPITSSPKKQNALPQPFSPETNWKAMTSLFSWLPLDNLINVLVQPVFLELHDPSGRRSAISAIRASFDTAGDIVFSGLTTVVVGRKTFFIHEARLNIANQRISSDSTCRWMTGNGSQALSPCSVDLFSAEK